MKLMTLPQYLKMSKPALIRKITKALRAMPKAKLARLCYNLTKSKLPRLRKYKTFPRRPSLGVREKMPDEEIYFRRRLSPKRKTKRKFSRKQLAAQRLFAKRARAGTLKTMRGTKEMLKREGRRRR